MDFEELSRLLPRSACAHKCRSTAVVGLEIRAPEAARGTLSQPTSHLHEAGSSASRECVWWTPSPQHAGVYGCRGPPRGQALVSSGADQVQCSLPGPFVTLLLLVTESWPRGLSVRIVETTCHVPRTPLKLCFYLTKNLFLPCLFSLGRKIPTCPWFCM